jgi:biopolymer transport protein ExbD
VVAAIALAIGACAPTKSSALPETLDLPPASEIERQLDSQLSPGTIVVEVRHRRESPSSTCAEHAAGRPCRTIPHWLCVVDGIEQRPDETSSTLDRIASEELESDVDRSAGVRLSTRRVLLRADKDAPYEPIRAVLQMCARATLYKTDIAASFEGREVGLECWLPREGRYIAIRRRESGGVSQELRVSLDLDESRQRTTRTLGMREVDDDEELVRLLVQCREDLRAIGFYSSWPEGAELPLTIAASGDVPWSAVVNAISLGKRSQIANVEFADGLGFR